MHTTGDALVVAQQERAYAQAVRAAGNTGLLRQAFVHRAGHCSFTPEQLNAAAEALRPTLQVPTPSAFLAYSRGPYLRPFNLPPFVANVAHEPLRLDTAASWSVAEVF
jgi:hypothetical protein